MSKIQKRKLYLNYLEEINEGKSREKKIADAVSKIKKFLVNDTIINFIVDSVVDKETSKGVKYLVWLADLVKNDIISNLHIGAKEYINSFKEYITTGKMNDNYSKKEFDDEIDTLLDELFYDYEFEQVPITLKINHIVDWLKSPLRQDEETDLSKYHTLDDAFQEAKEWHDELRASGVIKEEHGKVIKIFDDGWYWIDLETTEDLDEAEAMGHCGRTTEGTTLYSLRKNMSPHVTMAINTKEGYITQCKGRNNKKPIEKYHSYIVDLMIDKDFQADKFFLEYDTGDDFSIDDLNDEMYKKLITNNIKWLNLKYDMKHLYNLLIQEPEFINKLKELPDYFLYLFKIIFINKENKNIQKIINFLDKDIFHDFNKNKEKYENEYDSLLPDLKYENEIVTLKDSIRYNSKNFLKEINFVVPLLPNSDFDNTQIYRNILKDFYKSWEELNITWYDAFFKNTLKKFKEFGGVYWSPKLKNLYNNYNNTIFPEKFNKEKEEIYKTIKEKTGVNIISIEDKYITYQMSIINFCENLFSDISSDWFVTSTFIDDFIDALRNLKKCLQSKFSIVKYEPKYDFLTDINKYVLDNINNDSLNESFSLNEKLSVADAIEEWYDLIYYIVTVQLNAFVDAVKKDPEMFEKILQIDDDEVNVYTAEVSTQKEINKLITKYIKKTNKLKLKNLTLNLSITILPLENFSNYIFPTDAYYNDSDAYFDGTYLNDCEIYLELYLPEEVLNDENNLLVKIMNDYEINLKLRQSLSHELDHAYEFFNRIKTGNAKIPETELNKIRSSLSDTPFSQISQDFLEFLNLIYISMSFEGSARITQIYFQLKEYKIDNEAYFWSIVKNSFGWKDLESLKNFNPVEFYNNIKFEICDEDIKEALIESGVYKSEDFEKTSIKLLVVKYWLKIFDKLIEDVNKKGKVKLPRINKQMFDHPVLFFKYYDKKFKQSWQHFYDRIVKISILHIKPKNHL